MPGWTGKILRVDLSKSTSRVEPADPDSLKSFIGGRGAAVRLLCDELDPRVDALSPDNKLIFATGPLTGTGAIAGCLFVVVTKSPLTGGVACSASQGFFGTELKQAGFDMLVVEGRAESPVCIEINNGKVELIPAGHLWGLSTSQTEDLIKVRMHDKWKASDTSIACIGPAGEKLSRFASIVNDRHWAAARGGTGAVMGSKNLKAVVVNGTQDIYVASVKPFMDVVLSAIDQVKAMPVTSKNLPESGTLFILDALDEIGGLGARNFQGNVSGSSKTLSEGLRKLFVRRKGCFSCPIGCEHTIREGQCNEAMAPGYEAASALSPGCGIYDANVVAQAHTRCLELGLDPVSTGGTIACAMELNEKGWLPDSDSGAVPRFGDGVGLAGLIESIGQRQGFGDVLAEGGWRLAQKYGHSEVFMGVRGQEMAAFDPRAVQGLGLHYATANTGPSLESGDTLLSEVLSVGGNIDASQTDGKAAMVKETQDMAAVLDSCGLCRKILMGGFSVMEVYAMMEMVTASGITDTDLLKAGERIFNLERMFNLKAGLSGADDTLPARMLEQPLAGGQVSRIAEMLPEYRRLRGWDDEGIPGDEKLAELGLARAEKAGNRV